MAKLTKWLYLGVDKDLQWLADDKATRWGAHTVYHAPTPSNARIASPHCRISETRRSLFKGNAGGLVWFRFRSSMVWAMCFSNLNVPGGHLGIALKCTFWFGRSGVDLELLPLHNLQGDTDTAGPVSALWGPGLCTFCSSFLHIPFSLMPAEWKEANDWASVLERSLPRIRAFNFYSDCREFFLFTIAQNLCLQYRVVVVVFNELFVHAGIKGHYPHSWGCCGGESIV